ncbi:MAG: class I SAM-dependent methyltransferase [Xanthobacteraceae bacterium]
MSFSAEWLGLREPYDRGARNAQVLEAVAREFREEGAIGVVDLACGTGSTLRALAPYLPSQQSWRLVDNDLGLLARAAAEGRPPRIAVTTRPVDLARDLELALEAPLHLVTTSALLDLVSAPWLDRLIVESAARRLPVYAGLSYDGRVSMQPSLPFDEALVAEFNRHQLTDKGFGPALGPLAGATARERFAHFGYQVVQGQSDWVLGAGDEAIQDALFAGWAEVATRLSDDAVARWLAGRREHLRQGTSRLRVGHIDIFARPTGTR